MANDSHVIHLEPLHAMQCLACLELIEIPKHLVYGRGDDWTEFCRMVEIDHSECHKYTTVEGARLARKYRKEWKRREITGESRRDSGRTRDGSCCTNSAKPAYETNTGVVVALEQL